MPTANPRVTSRSTKCHQTKSDFDGSSEYANASTAGSAKPSFSPDSRFSECRTIRGTRGFVTTLEDSTGSVGASSAPTRNDSVLVKPESTSEKHPTSTLVILIVSLIVRMGYRHAFGRITSSTS